MPRRRDDDSGEFELIRDRRKGSNKTLLIVLGAVVGIVLLCGVSTVALKVMGFRASPPPTIEASSLLREFDANPARAKREHVDRLVRVRGAVSGYFGESAVSMHGENGTAVTCFFVFKSDVERVSKGQLITVEGRVSLGNEGGVWVKGCVLAN